jgi:hypothetical protein
MSKKVTEEVVHAFDDLATFADRGSTALGRTGTNVACRKHTGTACLHRQRLTVA